MAVVEQMKTIVPFVTCEIITLRQRVCELMFDINVPNLKFLNQE